MANPASRLPLLQTGALLALVVAIAQLGLGGYLISSPGDLNSIHSVIGLVAIFATGFAAIAAFLYKRDGGNPGLFFHAAGMCGIAVVQYALGEAGARFIHIMLGMLFVIGVVALFSLVRRESQTA